MLRSLGPILAIVLLAGCRSPTPPNDPFLYRSTIPPPGTMTPGAQPYYPSTGAPAPYPGAGPAPMTAPPLVTPGTPVPPGSVSPAPVLPPNSAAPNGPPNNYSPPGGFNFPQSSTPLPQPGSAQPTAAPAGGTNAQPATDTSVISASAWQQPPGGVASNTPAAAASPPIRIIEPPAKPAAPDPQATIISPGTPTSFPSATVGPPNAAGAPAGLSNSAVAPRDPSTPTEITDLPAVGSGANVVAPAAVASTAAASSPAATGPALRATNYAPPTVNRSQQQ